MRPEGVGGGEGGQYPNNLEEGSAVVAGDLDGGIHGLKELKKNPRGESGHCGEIWEWEYWWTEVNGFYGAECTVVGFEIQILPILSNNRHNFIFTSLLIPKFTFY